MTVEELKKQIEQRTGVSAVILTGETAEENIELARSLLNYKSDLERQRPKNTADQFADWLEAVQGIERQDAAATALNELAEAYRVESGGYPQLTDSGDAYSNGRQPPDARPAGEQFVEWINEQLAFDPRKL